MKKINIIKGVAALSMVSLVGGGIMIAQAASNNSNGLFGGRGEGKMFSKHVELTDEQKAEMHAKTEAVRAAIADSNYEAWVAAVKAEDENSPELEKINSRNFPTYVQAHTLRKQANEIMKNLGLGNERGMKEKRHCHEGMGFSGMMGEAPDAPNSN